MKIKLFKPCTIKIQNEFPLYLKRAKTWKQMNYKSLNSVKKEI